MVDAGGGSPAVRAVSPRSAARSPPLGVFSSMAPKGVAPSGGAAPAPRNTGAGLVPLRHSPAVDAPGTLARGLRRGACGPGLELPLYLL